MNDRSFSALDQRNVARFDVIDVEYQAQTNSQTLKVTITLDKDAGRVNASIFAATLT